MAQKSTGTIIGETGPNSVAIGDGILDAPSKPDSAIGDTINGVESFDPADARPTSGGTGKRRGRPRGTGSAQVASKKTANLDGIEVTILGVHQMLAAIAATPELELSESESAKLADNIKKVASFYDQSVIAPKTLAWLNLTMCCGTIYGPRIFTIINRPKRIAPKPQAPILDGTLKAQPVQSKPNGAPASPTAPQLVTPSQMWPAGVEDEIT